MLQPKKTKYRKYFKPIILPKILAKTQKLDELNCFALIPKSIQFGCVCVCVCVCVFIKLHLTAQSGPVIYSFHATACNPPGCVCVCCHLIYSGRQVCGRTSRGHTGGRSHRVSPPSFCGACLNFSREKDSAVPFPRRP